MKNSLRHLSAALVLVPSLILSGCAMGTYQAHSPARPAPCTTPVSPIRSTALAIVVNTNLTYNAQDPVATRENAPALIIARLNADGQSDGNTFSLANGTQENFTMTFTVNNDGQDHFTGSVYLAGWGQGFIANLGSGQYPFNNGPDAIDALADQAYSYIHLGWHDSRPTCPQN